MLPRAAALAPTQPLASARTPTLAGPAACGAAALALALAQQLGPTLAGAGAWGARAAATAGARLGWSAAGARGREPCAAAAGGGGGGDEEF